MTESRPYVQANEAECQRLRGLALILTNPQLAQRMPNGWTVASALVHLAFWDLRAAAILKKWKKEGFHPAPSLGDPDPVNEAVNTLGETIASGAAVALAVYAAGLVDKEIAELPANLVEEIIKNQHDRYLNRHLHRKNHLDKVEALLKIK